MINSCHCLILILSLASLGKLIEFLCFSNNRKVNWLSFPRTIRLQMMDIPVSKMIEIVPTVMKRYEDLVRKQREDKIIRYQACCLQTDSYMGAPILRDVEFVGICYNMTPAPDFVPITDEEVIAKREFMCTLKIVPTER